MKRTLMVMFATASVLAVAACGGASAAGSSTSPSPGGGGQARNGAAGQLVQINGPTLILTAASGDVTVTYTNATTFTKTSAAVLADVAPGPCLVARRQTASAGIPTATTGRLS